jgi:hypothetical protein
VAVPLSFLRSLSNQFLPDSCDVVRGANTSTGDGTSVVWTAVATGVACRVSPSGAGATESTGASGGIQDVAGWTIWLPALTDVRVTDRIVFGPRTFEVSRVGARSYEAVRELLCEEVL